MVDNDLLKMIIGNRKNVTAKVPLTLGSML
jgi:hypothetical protein